MFELLFSWPDELSSSTAEEDNLIRSAGLIRKGEYKLAESLLVSNLSYLRSNLHADALVDSIFINYFLLFWLFRLQKHFLSACKILDYLEVNYGDSSRSNFLRLLRYIYWIDTRNISSLKALTYSDWSTIDAPLPSMLFYADFCLLIGNIKSAQTELDRLSTWWQQTLEVQLLLARSSELYLSWDKVLTILLSAVERFPNSLEANRYLLYATVQAKSHEHALPSLDNALNLYGLNPLFFSHLCRISLLQFRSADARRYCLLDRLTTLTSTPDIPAFLTNLWITQERLGYSSWLEFFNIENFPVSSLPFAMLEPLMLQNASIQGFNDLSSQLLQPILASYRKQNISLHSANPRKNIRSQTIPEQLTIAWISSDINLHPVARFLYGFFASVSHLNHRHVLVDVNDHGSESIRPWFEDLDSLEVVNYGVGDISHRIDKVRQLSADIAIDLNGWTGSNLLRGFYAGLAPVQVNYLGYFASTGLSQMDYWLGDDSLFSDSFTDRHTEELYRLKRCFIAWQPSDPLPEASLDVVTSSNRNQISFGSFNHNRKLSNSTLSLWGRILRAIPGSTLVLKASNRNDLDTQELLRRRMLRNGLDTNCVIWLPRAPTSIDHLQQYSHIDIALDCFPNGGCTTTCEALWMGVPVISLSGHTYASRMSTAVLHGADLSNWCVSSQDEYFRLAVAQVDNLYWLRSNRDSWRKQLRNNSLGRADLLMDYLECAFTDMFTNSR